MDPLQALSTKSHLEVLKTRISYLKCELETALENGEDTNKEIEAITIKQQSIEAECEQRQEELNSVYNEEIQEYNKQVKLAEEMMEKKREERRALLDYLYESKICERSVEDLNCFDWDALKKMAISCNDESADELRTKPTVLADLNQKARSNLNETFELLTTTIAAKDRVQHKLEELKSYRNGWEETSQIQEKKIIKMRLENERLNLLIKQCALSNEPMSEYVTKNVRDKCHSFLSSSCPEELINGLRKYRVRQQRMIKLLKHKVNKLARETNLLQVATDQTTDQMQYYLNIIQTNCNK